MKENFNNFKQGDFSEIENTFPKETKSAEKIIETETEKVEEAIEIKKEEVEDSTEKITEKDKETEKEELKESVFEREIGECQYCSGGGPCIYCDRGRGEITKNNWKWPRFR